MVVENVLLTGGCAAIPGIRDRVEADLRMTQPFQSEIGVTLAKDPVYGSWKGVQQWYAREDRSQCAVTKAMYEEFGGEYLKEHQLSNKYYATPTVPINS